MHLAASGEASSAVVPWIPERRPGGIVEISLNYLDETLNRYVFGAVSPEKYLELLRKDAVRPSPSLPSEAQVRAFLATERAQKAQSAPERRWSPAIDRALREPVRLPEAEHAFEDETSQHERLRQFRFEALQRTRVRMGGAKLTLEALVEAALAKGGELEGQATVTTLTRYATLRFTKKEKTKLGIAVRATR